MSERTGTTSAVFLNLREGPGVGFNVITVLAPLTRFTLSGESGDWLNIATADFNGFIHRNFATLDEPPPPPPPQPTGRTTTRLNLRRGPSTAFGVVVVLLPGTILEILAEDGDWLQVSAEGTEGWVHGGFVVRDEHSGGSEPLDPTEPADDEGLAPAQLLDTPAGADATTRQAIRIWNDFGGILGEMSAQLSIDPGVAVAVFMVESGGRGFSSDGRMIIRFENHIFHNKWGQANQAVFDQHFRFDATKRWLGHEWRPTANEDWRRFHGTQSKEWDCFNFAQSLDITAARLSISMGAPQIMGFNHASLGFESVHQMFDAFTQGYRGQITAFFRFIQGQGGVSTRLLALRQLDFERFAALYNGTGQAQRYGDLIQTAFNAFKAVAG